MGILSSRCAATDGMRPMTLDSFDLVGVFGSSVTFSGTLQNSSGQEVFLNGAGGNLSYSELTLDVTPFFTFTPLSLLDGQSYAGELFSVAISSVAIPGDYGGAFIVQGGLDAFTFDILALQDFQVTVSDPIPEPTSVILLGGGLLGIITIHRSRFKRTWC